MEPTTELVLSTPGGHRATMLVREGTNDADVARSCLAEDEYRVADHYPITGLVLDIGAHIGAFAIGVLLDNPQATAELIEPVPENVALARRNLRANGLEERATVIEGAAGAAAVTAYWIGDESAAVHRYIANQTMPPDTEGSRIDVGQVDLPSGAQVAKLDCEGCEWAVLAELAPVSVIVGEAHGGTAADLERRLPDHDITPRGTGVFTFTATRRDR